MRFGSDDGGVVVGVAHTLFDEASGVDFLKQRAEGSVSQEGEDDGAVAAFVGISAAIDEDEPAHFFGILQSIPPSDIAAHGGSADDEFVDAELACDFIDEVDISGDGVVVIGCGTCEAVAGCIHSNDAECFTELLDPRLPSVERGV